MSSQSKLINEMKVGVEALWQKLIYAQTEAEKEKLRAEYQRAFRIYQTQCLIEEESPEPASERPVERKERERGYPSPFDFNDYQEYLLAWFRYYKDRKKGTLEEFSNKTGLKADYFVRVLKRTKRLEPEAHAKVLEYLDLPATERAFLDALYHVSETDSKEMRLAAMRRLMSFAAFRENNPREYEVWRYLTHWYYVVIREMATLPGFKPDPKWIHERLRRPVAPSDIQKALVFLEGAGFFKRTEDGRIEALAKNVKCSGGVFRVALGQFHRELLEIASSAIQDTPSDQRLLLGHTVAVPKEKYDQVTRILSDAMEKIKDLGAGEGATDEILHIEVAAFPLTRNPSAETP